MTWLNGVLKAVNYDQMKIAEKRYDQGGFRENQFFLEGTFNHLLEFIWLNHTLNWRLNSPGVVSKHFRLAIGMGNGSYELYKQNSQMDMGRAVGGVFVTKNLLGPHYEIVG